MSNEHQNIQSPIYRINYRINYCTSQDASYPCSSLCIQSVQSCGWQSKRFSTYPQTLILQLSELAYIKKLTFLSHQSKISTKIDIQSRKDQSSQWKKLGYTCMQSNMNTNYQSRQLRAIKLNKQLVKYFRLTLHTNYQNSLNVFSQVGLIAISVYGERQHPRPETDLRDNGILPPGAILDKQTIDKLRELQYMKRQAIDSNQFEKAAQIKNQIDKLKSGVEALAILEKQKKDAIRRQDYQQARKIYEKMKKIRGPIPRASQTSNDRYQKQVSSDRNINTTLSPIVNKEKKSISTNVSGVQSPINQLKLSSLQTKQLVKKQKGVVNFDQIKILPKKENIFAAEYLQQQEQKYIKPKFQQNTKPFLHKNRKNPQITQQPQEKQEIELPMECREYFTVVQETIFRNFFSKDNNLRQYAVEQVINIIDKVPQDQYLQKLFINAMIYVVKQTINDKVVSILLKSIDLLGLTLKQFTIKQGDITLYNVKNVKKIISSLSQYLGHSSQVLKSSAQDVYLILPKMRLTTFPLSIQTITLNPNPDRSPRIILNKLLMIGKLIRKYYHKVKAKSFGFDGVVQYVKKFVEDRNAQVKDKAIKLLVYVGKIIGEADLIDMMQDVKQSIKENIKIKIYQDNQSQSNNNYISKQTKQTKQPHIKRNSPQIKSPNVLSPSKKPQLKSKSPTGVKKNIGVQKDSITYIPSAPLYIPSSPQYSCQYCQLFDKRFQNQSFLQIHWYKYCPLITICPQCNLAIQVQCLNQHLLQQCQNKKYYKKCVRCKEAIKTKEFNQHLESKMCITAKLANQANRCALCHQDVQPRKKGWLKHLRDEGCPCSKRNK